MVVFYARKHYSTIKNKTKEWHEIEELTYIIFFTWRSMGSCVSLSMLNLTSVDANANALEWKVMWFIRIYNFDQGYPVSETLGAPIQVFRTSNEEESELAVLIL